jgi:uncharacterized membrane-anchored protein
VRVSQMIGDSRLAGGRELDARDAVDASPSSGDWKDLAAPLECYYGNTIGMHQAGSLA